MTSSRVVSLLRKSPRAGTMASVQSMADLLYWKINTHFSPDQKDYPSQLTQTCGSGVSLGPLRTGAQERDSKHCHHSPVGFILSHDEQKICEVGRSNITRILQDVEIKSQKLVTWPKFAVTMIEWELGYLVMALGWDGKVSGYPLVCRADLNENNAIFHIAVLGATVWERQWGWANCESRHWCSSSYISKNICSKKARVL